MVAETVGWEHIMNQTSQAAAVAVPLAAALGLVGLISIPALAMRSVRDAVCPQRARREALAAAGRAGAPTAAGGTSSIGAQRDARSLVGQS